MAVVEVEAEEETEKVAEAGTVMAALAEKVVDRPSAPSKFLSAKSTLPPLKVKVPTVKAIVEEGLVELAVARR